MEYLILIFEIKKPEFVNFIEEEVKKMFPIPDGYYYNAKIEINGEEKISGIFDGVLINEEGNIELRIKINKAELNDKLSFNIEYLLGNIKGTLKSMEIKEEK